jgi:capsular polysaccharide biosynthesis protein
VSSHYWHFHHETLGQFLVYKDLGVFEKISPENTAILLTRNTPGKFAKEAFKYVFGFDIEQYELMSTKKNVLYKTTKDMIATTKTSTAGCLPLSYFSEKLAKYLVPEENPTEFIYISRDDSDCRLLLNQDEILQYLNENGIPIRKITMTGMPYLEQVNLFRSSKLVITISGSGSTNQIYCNPDKSKVLFIAPKKGALNCSSYTAKKMNMGCATLEGYENFTPENKQRATDPTCANFKLEKEAVLVAIQDLCV